MNAIRDDLLFVEFLILDILMRGRCEGFDRLHIEDVVPNATLPPDVAASLRYQIRKLSLGSYVESTGGNAFRITQAGIAKFKEVSDWDTPSLLGSMFFPKPEKRSRLQ